MRPRFSLPLRARAVYYSRKNRLGQGFDKVVVSGRKNGWETAFHFS